MSMHIDAKAGDIAETVLLAGDPLRAKYLAETYLENPIQYNFTRGMYGYTGHYKGKRISVQGTGMGMPSMAIYARELLAEYPTKRLVRIGSCGAMQDDIKLRDLILAQGASTDSSFNRLRFNMQDYAPLASWNLLKEAEQIATNKGIPVRVGNVFSTDNYYREDLTEATYQTDWKHWAAYGVLVVEMETVALYTLAAHFGKEALSILTVSDHLGTGDLMDNEEREKGFKQMAEIALEL